MRPAKPKLARIFLICFVSIVHLQIGFLLPVVFSPRTEKRPRRKAWATTIQGTLPGFSGNVNRVFRVYSKDGPAPFTFHGSGGMPVSRCQVGKTA